MMGENRIWYCTGIGARSRKNSHGEKNSTQTLFSNIAFFLLTRIFFIHSSLKVYYYFSTATRLEYCVGFLFDPLSLKYVYVGQCCNNISVQLLLALFHMV